MTFFLSLWLYNSSSSGVTRGYDHDLRTLFYTHFSGEGGMGHCSSGRAKGRGRRISGFQNLSLFENKVIVGFEFFTLDFVGETGRIIAIVRRDVCVVIIDKVKK